METYVKIHLSLKKFSRYSQHRTFFLFPQEGNHCPGDAFPWSRVNTWCWLSRRFALPARESQCSHARFYRWIFGWFWEGLLRSHWNLHFFWCFQCFIRELVSSTSLLTESNGQCFLNVSIALEHFGNVTWLKVIYKSFKWLVFVIQKRSLYMLNKSQHILCFISCSPFLYTSFQKLECVALA